MTVRTALMCIGAGMSPYITMSILKNGGLNKGLASVMTSDQDFVVKF